MGQAPDGSNGITQVHVPASGSCPHGKHVQNSGWRHEGDEKRHLLGQGGETRETQLVVKERGLVP